MLACWPREQRLIRRYHRMKGEGARSTPAIVLTSGETCAIVAAPSDDDPCWMVLTATGERRIATDEIAELDSARFLAGYDP